MDIKVPRKPEILWFTLYRWSLSWAMLNLYSHGDPCDRRCNTRLQSPSVTAVLLSLPGAKERAFCSLQRFQAYTQSQGYLYRFDPAGTRDKLCLSGDPFKAPFLPV